MRALAIFLNLVVMAIALWRLWRGTRRWEQAPRPYECFRCRVDYTDARQLAWHNASHHPETYDE
jgi:hypothetical protein